MGRRSHKPEVVLACVHRMVRIQVDDPATSDSRAAVQVSAELGPSPSTIMRWRREAERSVGAADDRLLAAARLLFPRS